MVSIEKAKQFFVESRQELRKVTWTSKQQIITSTWIVLIMIIVVAVFFGIADYIIGKVIKILLGI